MRFDVGTESAGMSRVIIATMYPRPMNMVPNLNLGQGLLPALRSIKENVRERWQTYANSPSNFNSSRRTFAANRKRILRWHASLQKWLTNVNYF